MRSGLERCPGAVFLVYPTTVRKPGREAAGWQVAPVFTGRCTERIRDIISQSSD
ncbi:MAG: hypothetical protein RDV00_06190 [Clostridia bacterium]|nr:hypothetical protein [Clostridia bacterium]